MINYVYVVKYITQTSIFNSYIYEDYIFINLEDAYQKMLEIVKEEERSSNDSDFFKYHIVIEGKVVDKSNPWEYNEQTWFYDLSGTLIGFSETKSLKEDKCTLPEISKFKRGDIIKINPYPWNKWTKIPFEVYGVIAMLPNQNDPEYVVYILDKNESRFFHSHECENAMQKINDIQGLDINIKLVSQILKEEIVVKNKTFEDELCDGKILASTKKRLIDLTR